jgi:hypothetical protein
MFLHAGRADDCRRELRFGREIDDLRADRGARTIYNPILPKPPKQSCSLQAFRELSVAHKMPEFLN